MVIALQLHRILKTWGLTIALTLLLAPSISALAAPGFVASTSVQEGTIYTEIRIRFRCQVQYVGHDPSAKGDLLRIRLEPTTICVGASPSLAESSEQHRPLDADAARLVSIDYDGNAPGNAYLTLHFEDEVRYSVVGNATSEVLTVRVYQPARASEAPVARTAPARLRQQPSAPGLRLSLIHI